LNNITLKKRLGILIAIFVVIILAESILIFTGSQVSNEQIHSISERSIPALNKAHELKLSVVQVQQWLTDISATRGLDGLNDGFDEAENNAKLFKSLISELSQLDPDNADTYQSLNPIFDTYYSAGKTMAQAYIEGGPAGGNPMMAQFDAAALALATRVDALVDDTKSISAEILQQHISYMGDQNIKRMASFAILFAVILFVYFIMSKALSLFPLVVKELNKVASGDMSGDTHSNLSTTNNDELGQICHAVQNMKIKLRELISQVGNSASQCASSSGEMATITGDALQNMQNQNSEIEQVATAMNEMTSTVAEVAQNTSNAADSAQQAQESTHNGQMIVNETIQVINELATGVENASEAIQAVQADSEQIGTVLDVIKGIAEQTNLLALNAAIEAARAGEQGRGFAVVADEVRTLASRTQESTQEIQAMIERLQTGSRNAVEAMSQGRKQAENGVSKVKEAGEALQQITAAVNTISDMNLQIASAAEEQNSVAEEVNRNITNISQIAEQTVTTTEQIATSGNELEHMAVELQQLVSQFKT
jgi:methyl-accepting chemotaxis protein